MSNFPDDMKHDHLEDKTCRDCVDDCRLIAEIDDYIEVKCKAFFEKFCEKEGIDCTPDMEKAFRGGIVDGLHDTRQGLVERIEGCCDVEID